MEFSQQEIEYARQLAAIRRAKRGIGVSKDTGKSRYARNGGNPNGPADPPQEETLPEEEQPGAAGQLREAVGEKAKEVAKKVAKEAAKKVAKKAAMALLKNPYVLAAIGIILGIIFLIMIVVVIIQSPAVTREEEYETYTTEEGEERTIHMPQLKGL